MAKNRFVEIAARLSKCFAGLHHLHFGIYALFVSKLGKPQPFKGTLFVLLLRFNQFFSVTQTEYSLTNLKKGFLLGVQQADILLFECCGLLAEFAFSA